MPRAPKMVNLQIEETSGVDYPAHLREGWLVMKSDDATAVGEVLATLSDKEHDVAEPTDTTIAETETSEPTVADLQDALAKAEAMIADLEGRISEMSAPVEDAPVASEDDLLKAAPEPVVKMVEALRAEREEALAKAAEAEAVVKQQQDAASDAEAIAKAREWSHLSLNADEVGPVMRRLSEFDADLAKSVAEVLASVNAQAESANIFAEIGKSATPAEGLTPVDRMTSLAKAAVEAGEARTFEQAFSAVAMSNPDLYTDYLSQKGA